MEKIKCLQLSKMELEKGWPVHNCYPPGFCSFTAMGLQHSGIRMSQEWPARCNLHTRDYKREDHVQQFRLNFGVTFDAFVCSSINLQKVPKKTLFQTFPWKEVDGNALNTDEDSESNTEIIPIKSLALKSFKVSEPLNLFFEVFNIFRYSL